MPRPLGAWIAGFSREPRSRRTNSSPRSQRRFCGGGSSGFRGADVAKVDRIKEEIGWLKLVFGILVVIDVSLVGWLAQHYATASPVLVLAAVLATAVGTFAVVRVNRLAYHRIEQLEDL